MLEFQSFHKNELTIRQNQSIIKQLNEVKLTEVVKYSISLLVPIKIKKSEYFLKCSAKPPHIFFW